MESYIDYIRENFIESKFFGILLVIVFGVMMLWAAIKDWEWVFGDINRSNYSLSKLDGIINVFGRRTGRVVGGLIGVSLIFFGVIWVIYLAMYDKNN